MDEMQKKFIKEIEEMVETCVRLGDLGYVTSQGGNVSYRVNENTVLITPTQVSKRRITFEDIIILNLNGEVLFAAQGRRPTGETPFHLNIMRKRSDIKGLVHAHPPTLTGFALTDSDILSRPLLPEPVIEVGPVVRVRYEEPISDKLAAAFDNVVDRANAFLMENHGVLVCSSEGAGRALELLEMLEAMAYSVFVASIVGKVNEISTEEVANLEKTIKIRNLRLPGKPGIVKGLSDVYFPGK